MQRTFLVLSKINLAQSGQLRELHNTYNSPSINIQQITLEQRHQLVRYALLFAQLWVGCANYEWADAKVGRTNIERTTLPTRGLVLN